jgi:hypothetical protein
VSRIQQAEQRVSIDRIRLEVAHIAPLGDGPVHGGAFGIAESESVLAHGFKAPADR